MSKRKFAIMGATGNIGHVLVQLLLKKGHTVHAIGRNAQKLAHLKTLGADVFVSKNFEDRDALAEAFEGANAVFTFIPPGEQNIQNFGVFQDRVGEAIVSALKKSHITFAVNLSSVGAEHPGKTGPITGLYRQEQRLNALPNLKVLHLRPNYFMENLLHYIPLIKSKEIIGSSLKGDLPIPMIASVDISNIAAEFLDQLSFTSHQIFDIVGPKEVTLKDTTKILGKAIENPQLKFVQLSYEEEEKGMVNAGFQPDTARLMIEMYKAFNEHLFKPTQKMTSQNKGKITLEQFAPIFAQAFKKEKSHATAKSR